MNRVSKVMLYKHPANNKTSFLNSFRSMKRNLFILNPGLKKKKLNNIICNFVFLKIYIKVKKKKTKKTL